MSRPLRLACWACAALSVASVAGAETLVVDSVLSTPTVYLAPTTYAVPTAYASPTVYASTYATAYSLAPTAYYDASPTSYLVPTYREARYLVPRRYRRRSYVATSYYDAAVVPTYYEAPTTYVAPTTYYVPTTSTLIASPMVATATSVCNEPARVSTGLPTSEPDPTTIRRGPATAASPPERRNEGVVVSVPKEGEPPLGDRGAGAARPNVVAPNPPDADPAPAPASPPAAESPAIPGPAGDDLGDPGKPAPHVVQRPAFGSFGILRGAVLSIRTYTPEEGVKVTISSRSDPAAFADRVASSDADGRFAIRVPNGDWTVKVVTPEGKVLEKKITVSGGRVAADTGEESPFLRFKI